MKTKYNKRLYRIKREGDSESRKKREKSYLNLECKKFEDVAAIYYKLLAEHTCK